MSIFSTVVTDIEKVYDKIRDDIKGINWSEVTTYWQDFVKGLEAALPLVEELFPHTQPAVDSIVKPIVADANAAVTALVGTVHAYQQGTLSEADAISAAQQVNTAVKAANAVVGQALKGQVGQAPKTAAKPAAVAKAA